MYFSKIGGRSNRNSTLIIKNHSALFMSYNLQLSLKEHYYNILKKHYHIEQYDNILRIIIIEKYYCCEERLVQLKTNLNNLFSQH